MNHRRRQHFFRQVEEFCGKRAGDDGWILDEIRHLVEQAALMRTRSCATRPPSRRACSVELADDPVAALLAIEDHEVLGSRAR